MARHLKPSRYQRSWPTCSTRRRGKWQDRLYARRRQRYSASLTRWLLRGRPTPSERRSGSYVSSMPHPPSLDIAAIAGALGLTPANATHEGSLFRLLRVEPGGTTAAAAVTVAGRGARAARVASRAALGSDRDLVHVAHPVPWWRSLVLTGGYEGLDTAVEHIVASLFLHEDAPPDALSRQAFQLTSAVLRLSDHVVRAAGLGRHEPYGLSNEVVVPTTAKLRRLLAAVSFTRLELDEITSVGARALEPLIADVRTSSRRRTGSGRSASGRSCATTIGSCWQRRAAYCSHCATTSCCWRSGTAGWCARGAHAEARRASGERCAGAARLDEVAVTRVPDPALPVIEQLWGFDAGAGARHDRRRRPVGLPGKRPRGTMAGLLPVPRRAKRTTRQARYVALRRGVR